MMDLDPNLCVRLPQEYPGRRCFMCREVRVGFIACLEAVLTEPGELVGIAAHIRFLDCGHTVPGIAIRPEDLAEWLNEHEDDEDDDE